MCKIAIAIMTQNEIANIRNCISSARLLSDDIFVVDSYSNDGTYEYLKSDGTLNLFQNVFVNWADQRNFLVEKIDHRFTHVLFLDADEMLTKTISDEIKRLDLANVDAAIVGFDYVFLGRVLKYSYRHPQVRRLFRKDLVHFRSEGAREYSEEVSKQITLKNKIWHEDRKPLSEWMQKHLRNAKRELDFLKDDAKNSHLKHRFWAKLPLVWRVLPYFLFRYIFKLGFLDGREGYIYLFLHAFWYRTYIDAQVIEVEK